MRSGRLNLDFDPAALGRGLAAVQAAEWVQHFNQADFTGDWDGVALRSTTGRPETLYPDPTATADYRDTALLQIPELAEVLAAFSCELTSVRLLRLAPGSRIREHRDHRLSRADGEVRLHVPIITNEAVDFRLDGERVVMRAGQTWYLDLTLPHSVTNQGQSDRVHLVLDCVVNDWLDDLLDSATAPKHAATPTAQVVMASDAKRAARTSDPNPGTPDLLTRRLLEFVRSIGITATIGALESDGAVPGVAVRGGGLIVDPTRLTQPGDILHEAGHLAVLPPSRRSVANGVLDGDGGNEIAAIAWSYAAACELGLDPAVVFHNDGYRGDADALIDNFTAGRPIGVPLLEWFGLTHDHLAAERLGTRPYPAMRAWLRTEPASTEPPATAYPPDPVLPVVFGNDESSTDATTLEEIPCLSSQG